MPDIFDYQKETGTLERWDYDPMTGVAYVNRQQDLREWRRAVTETRLTGSAAKGIGPDNEVVAAYSIPVTIEVELLKKGIRVGSGNPEMERRLIKELETNYPACKLGEKKLWRPT